MNPLLWTRVRKTTLVWKYSDDQARDDQGRFASGGAAAGGHSPHWQDFSARLAQPDGGFTVNTVTGSEPHGPGNYIVSIYPQASQEVASAKDLSPGTLSKYVLAHQDLLTRPGHYFGGWHDPETGKIWLDTSVVVHDRQQAERLATAHNQRAYFDLGAGKSVATGGTGEAPSHGGKGATEPARRERAEGRNDVRAGDPRAAQEADRSGRDPGRSRRSASGRDGLLRPADWRVERRFWDAALKADRPVLLAAGDADAVALVDTPLYDASWPAPVKAAARQEPGFAKALVSAWQQAQAALNVTAVASAIRRDDQKALIAAIQATRVNDRTKAAVTPLIQHAFLVGVQQGKPALARVGVRTRGYRKDDGPGAVMDLSSYNPQAVIWAENHAGELLLAEDDEKELVRLLTVEAVAGTATVDELAAAVRSVIGLTPGAMQSVVQYLLDLEDADTPEESIVSKVLDYAEAKLNERAMTVARTETMAASNGGQLALWQNAQSNNLLGRDMLKEWIVTDDGNVCDICAALGDDDPVPINDVFGDGNPGPPDHPRCRCTVGLVRASDSGSA